MNAPSFDTHALNRRVFPRIERINCDHTPHLLELDRCRKPADMAPRLCVPSKTQAAPGHDHVHVDFKSHHYCQSHVGELRLDDILVDKLKADIEAHARKVRPIDFKCDFAAAHLVYVNVFTPQYKWFEDVKHLKRGDELMQAWGGLVA